MPATGARNDPLAAFRFLVRIEGRQAGGFSEVSGIQAEVEVLEVAAGGENTFVHKLPGRTRHGNLTLRRGLATLELWDWFADIVAGRVSRRTVSVELLPGAQEGRPVRWVFESAFPAKWTGPELKADQSAIAVEAVELAYHGFVVEE